MRLDFHVLNTGAVFYVKAAMCKYVHAHSGNASWLAVLSAFCPDKF